MSLAADLVAQARLLAVKEPRRPKQASLRRAISAAYYALFHFLIDEATSYFVSGRAAQRSAQRKTLARAFDHGQMRRNASAFERRRPSPWTGIGASAPVEIETMASVFLKLQDLRHRADYDRTAEFTRRVTLSAIDQVERSMRSWRRVKRTAAAEAFLLGLLVQGRA